MVSLYQAASFITVLGRRTDYADMAVDVWFRRDRSRPVAPYSRLIKGYDQLDPSEKRQRENLVDELFTDREVGMLRSYLKREMGMALFVSPVPLPTDLIINSSHWLADRCFDAHRLENLPGYSLPFPTWGVFRCKDVWVNLSVSESLVKRGGVAKCLCGAELQEGTKAGVLWDQERVMTLVCADCYAKGPAMVGEEATKAGMYMEQAGLHAQSMGVQLSRLRSWTELPPHKPTSE